MAQHKSAYTFLHSLPRVSPGRSIHRHLLLPLYGSNSDSVALLKKKAADGLYQFTQTCVVTLYHYK